MSSYSITFARSARKELQALEQGITNRIVDAIEGLALQPRPAGCKKLRGSGDLWRIRVSDYRIVYGIDDSEMVVDVIVIRHRRDAYR